MTEANRRSSWKIALSFGPLWLRILAGILTFVLSVSIGLAMISGLWFEALLLLVALFGCTVLSAFLGWIVFRKSSTRVAAGLSAVTALLCLGLWLLGADILQWYEGWASGLHHLGAGEPHDVVPPEPSPSGGNDRHDQAPNLTDMLPQFPWPPPAASASYVLPDALLKGRRTVGEVVAAIISALEFNGYVERSFLQAEGHGVALVTRLERINDDGSSAVGPERWSAAKRPGSADDLIRFLRGLFFVDPGHYRVIVFILQDLPFSQSFRRISEEEANAWLTSGFNILPASIAERPFAPDSHCTVLVYEFASDGKTVHVVTSGLTGKQHLEKAGVLSLLGNAN
jgi:hypothetical protein